MTTITVPKALVKQKDLMVISRQDYQEFLRWSKKLAFFPTYKPTMAEKKALERARRNYAKGNYLTLVQARDALGIKNR